MRIAIILALSAVLYAGPAHAVTAFFDYRIEDDGWVHQCVYKSIYGRHVINVRSTELCPLTIEV
jgi:hypothetical protein